MKAVIEFLDVNEIDEKGEPSQSLQVTGHLSVLEGEDRSPDDPATPAMLVASFIRVHFPVICHAAKEWESNGCPGLVEHAKAVESVGGDA